MKITGIQAAIEAERAVTQNPPILTELSFYYVGKIRYAYILTDSLTLWKRGD
ncbi:MAG: hypothetical protein PHX74_12135 [Candidatus Sumerlaeales bacterium]|nr:hypothetical protein [Candidatus Sumerlaeales bacterium]